MSKKRVDPAVANDIDSVIAVDIEETVKYSSVENQLDLRYMADLQDIKLKKQIIWWVMGVVTTYLLTIIFIMLMLTNSDKLETTVLLALISPIHVLGVSTIIKLLPKNQKFYKSPKNRQLYKSFKSLR